jgi:hypothetical protein
MFNDTKSAFFILDLVKTFLSSAPAVEAFYSNISKCLYLTPVQNLFSKRCGSYNTFFSFECCLFTQNESVFYDLRCKNDELYI